MIRQVLIAVTLIALIGRYAKAEPFALGRRTAPLAPDAATHDSSSDSEVPDEPYKPVPEFPPGLFTDGARYRLNDLSGKVVVLLFFDGGDSRFAASVPHYNAIIRLFRDKPVAFFGVQAASIARARADLQDLGLEIPVFADALGVMHLRYRATLSPTRSWHVVIISPAGDIADDDMTADAIESRLQSARWNLRQILEPFDPKLSSAVDLLEAGDYRAAARQITSISDGMDPSAAQSARQMLAVLSAAAQAWRDHAKELPARRAVEAYDLYTRAAPFLSGTDAGKSVTQSLATLKNDSAVRRELAARAMYEMLCSAVSADERVDRSDAVRYCGEIIRTCPGTPTAQSLVAYLDDLGKVRPPATGAVRRRRGR
jgi:hypothetical protein